MAYIVDQGEEEIFEPSCHVGKYGDIILNISEDHFIKLSALEAKELIKSLADAVEEYKNSL